MSTRRDGLPKPATYAEAGERVRCLCALHHASVASNVRAEQYNADPRIGGHPNSYHLISRGSFAWDLHPYAPTPEKLAALVRDATVLGFEVIAYSERGYVHLEMPEGTHPLPIRSIRT